MRIFFDLLLILQGLMLFIGFKNTKPAMSSDTTMLPYVTFKFNTKKSLIVCIPSRQLPTIITYNLLASIKLYKP